MPGSQTKELLPKKQKVTIVQSVQPSEEETEDIDDDDGIILELPPPPDGGWGWVVLVGGFMVGFVCDGITGISGIFLEPFMKHFNENRSKISLTTSLLAGVNMFLGPVVSGLTNRFGCRPVMIFGAVFASASLALSSISPSSDILILTYALTGMGFGIIYLPSVVAVSYYFEEKRAITSCIQSCGSAIGLIALAPVAKILLDSFGEWQNPNRILAGLVLSCLIYGAVMRPLRAVAVPKEENKEIIHQLNERRGTCVTFETGHFAFPKRELPLGSFRHKSVRFAMSNSSEAELSMIEEDETAEPEEDEPLATITEGETSTDFESKPEADQDEERKEEIKSDRPKSFEQPKVRQPRPLHRFASLPAAKQRKMPSFISRRRKTTPTKMSMKKKAGDEEEEELLPGIEIYSVNRRKSCFELPPNEKSLCVRLADTPRVQQSLKKRNIVSPLSRKDTFYTGSVKKLRRDHTRRSDLPYRQSVLNFNPVANVEVEKDTATTEERKGKCPRFLLHESCWNIISTMVDMSLMKKPAFLLLSLSNVFTVLGFNLPFVYLVDAATSKGLPEEQAAFLLSLIGITNALGRALSGVIANIKCINPLFIYNLSLIGTGVMVASMGFPSDYISYCLVAAFYGIISAPVMALTPIVLVNLLGLDKLTTGYGLIAMFRGIAAMLGPPLAGVVYSGFGGSDIASFAFGGVMILISAALGVMIMILEKCRPTKEAGDKESNASQSDEEN